jgi:peptide/nickel transport system substrate-binding protein
MAVRAEALMRIPQRAVRSAAVLALTGSILAGAAGDAASASTLQPPTPSGTLSVAEARGEPPSDIFPFLSCANGYTAANVQQFQELLYRPLYWFGLGSSITVQYPLSLATAPVFSGPEQVTINLKGWQFSNGQVVDAESVAFFLNLFKADPSGDCGYTPGRGIPDQLAGVSYPSGLGGDMVVLHFSAPVGDPWLLYDSLSTITPFPEAWDKTALGAADGSGGCATATYGSATALSSCLAVERFLDVQGSTTTTFTSPLWAVVDGPWSLSAFAANGEATFVPNVAYSGPQKAQLAQVVEMPYTIAAGEFNDLAAGRVQLGYVDITKLPDVAPGPGRVGRNAPALAAAYQLETARPWQLSYVAPNLGSSDPMAPVLRQLYVRRAMQRALDEPDLVRSAYKGYGVTSSSPLPAGAPSWVAGAVKNPDSYDPTAALALLVAHGWTLRAGVQVCMRAGRAKNDCGVGIAAGTRLQLTLLVDLGETMPEYEVTSKDVAQWGAIGVDVTSRPACGDVVASCPPCAVKSFELCVGGWGYQPDYYPTGESLFVPSGGDDVGSYASPEMRSLIERSTRGSSRLTAYATYAAKQLPVIYQPTEEVPVELARTVKCTLASACAASPIDDFLPEYMHF